MWSQPKAGQARVIARTVTLGGLVSGLIDETKMEPIKLFWVQGLGSKASA